MESREHTVIGLDGSPKSVLLGARYREAGPFPMDSASGASAGGWDDGGQEDESLKAAFSQGGNSGPLLPFCKCQGWERKRIWRRRQGCYKIGGVGETSLDLHRVVG